LIDSKRLLTVATDLDDPTQAKAFAQKSLEYFGRIDVLVNNAGVAPLSPFGAITEDSFEQLININVRSGFYLTQLAWNTMVKFRRSQRSIPLLGSALMGPVKLGWNC